MRTGIKLIPILFLSFFLSQAVLAERILQLDDGHPLIVTPTEEISSATHETNQLVTFKLLQECKVDGIVLIKEGTIVEAKIDEAVHSKMFGKQGVLHVSFLDTKAVKGETIPVRASILSTQRVAKTDADKVASFLPYGIGKLQNGKDALLKVGIPLTIFVDGTFKFRIRNGEKPVLLKK